MFDVGFSELMVIAIVALIVIGPERLPKVARTAGHLLGRLQRYVNDVKSDINREMQLDELRKLQAEVQESARSLERSVVQEMRTVEQGASETIQSVTDAVTVSPLAEEAAAQPPAGQETLATPTGTAGAVSDPLAPGATATALKVGEAMPR
jgi:sec-independent protein translocase protein TatB